MNSDINTAVPDEIKGFNLSEEIIIELADLGIIYGHKKSKTHPLMKEVIIDNRNEIEIMNPEAVIQSLENAISFIKEKAKQGILMLLVGTSPSAKEAIKSFAGEFGFPYVTERWLGGTLTNFNVMHKRIQYYEDLKAKMERGELTKYTKQEQMRFGKKIEKLRVNFEGLIALKRIPDVLFIVDINEHVAAVREAKHLNIPMIAIVDTDDNPTLVKYPIFASDHTKKSIEWVAMKLRKSLAETGFQKTEEPVKI